MTWLGILLCLSQSALLSGLNLGLFSISKLELQVEAKKGDSRARRILRIREDANFALATILWGNVGVNVLLALLSGSVLSGVAAFVFSTVVITVFAEIIPQSYFSRHSLRMVAMLAPVLRVYQVALYPVARLTALVLDRWLGAEGIRYFPERDLRKVIQLHMDSAASEIAYVEGQGALNFLELDGDRRCTARAAPVVAGRGPHARGAVRSTGVQPRTPLPSADHRARRQGKAGRPDPAIHGAAARSIRPRECAMA